MKTTLLLTTTFLALISVVQAAPLSTGFTYQGVITEAGKPKPGKFTFEHFYDFYDSPTGGLRVAGPVTNSVEVIDGVFTTIIDFGAKVFDGRQYWLEIGVRSTNTAAFTMLAPRQPVRPTPYALHALTSSGVSEGVINNAALALNAVSADKIAPGQVLKSLNGLTDGVELLAEGDLAIRQERNQLVLTALPSCFTYTNCYWNLRGNGNITAGVNFLGTVAGELDPLEFRVNNNRSLLHVFTGAGTAPNLIGGYAFNSISGTGGTISGGGQASGVNRVLASWGTIGGGFTNIIQTNATGGFIGGGATNTITGPYGAIGGGGMNISSNSSFVGGGVLNRSVSEGGVIGGGYSNLVASYDVVGGTIPSIYSAVGGGASNVIIGGVAGSLGGGQANRIVGNGGRQVNYATIAGGQGNAVLSDTFSSSYSSIGGGFSNRISTATRATIGGGDGSRILLEGHNSTISGGQGHTLDGPYGTISGGRSNVVVGPGNPDYGTIGGGEENAIVADSHYATIAGGRRNRIQGFASNSSIGGGVTNAVTGADFATIGGGGTNTIADNANFATIGGGRINSISSSATNATISGGRANLVDTSAPYAAIPGGQQARATNYNQYAFAGGGFTQTGDAQHSQYVLRNTSQGTNSVELFLDGVVREIVLWPSSVLTFDILLVGVSGNDSAGYQVRGVIERNGAGINFVGVPTTTTLGEDVLAWGVSVQPDPANNSLSIIANGAGNAVVRWVAHVRTVEVRL